MVSLNVDHVTVAWSDLAALRSTYEDVGIWTEYGGTHSNGQTHMATLGFADGSYLELISYAAKAESAPIWDAHLREDGGTCAWAVGVDDAAAAAQTLRNRDIVVEGPVAMQRERPDGTVVTWELVFLGEEEPGAMLPFLIADETPRNRRITPSVAADNVGLTGVQQVVLGVLDLDEAVRLFETAFCVSSPELGYDEDLDARIATIPATPVVLASPGAGSRLTKRISQYGPSPCAVVLDSKADVDNYLDASAGGRLLDTDVAWIGPADDQGLGRVAVSR